MTGERRAAGVAVLGALSLFLLAADATPRRAMQGIFDAVSELLPLMLSDETYHSDRGQAKAAGLLRQLTSETDALEAHAVARDDDFRFFARSLGADLGEARRRFEAGQPDQARFFVAAAVENCVLCHSRLPKARDFPLATRLTERVEIQRLPASERALYHVATRSFEAAMRSWEAHFAMPSTNPSHLRTLPLVEEYLRVAISVQRDPERARETLGAMMARPDANDRVLELFGGWVEQLGELAPVIRAPATLEEARALVSEAGSVPDGGVQRLRDLVGASLLLRLIDETPAKRENAAMLGEAYYWLGVIEARSTESLWHPQTEFHLETAIRMAPKAPYARQALALYAETLGLGYTGSSGTHIPTDEHRRLRELERLVDGAPAEAG